MSEGSCNSDEDDVTWCCPGTRNVCATCTGRYPGCSLTNRGSTRHLFTEISYTLLLYNLGLPPHPISHISFPQKYKPQIHRWNAIRKSARSNIPAWCGRARSPSPGPAVSSGCTTLWSIKKMQMIALWAPRLRAGLSGMQTSFKVAAAGTETMRRKNGRGKK